MVKVKYKILNCIMIICVLIASVAVFGSFSASAASVTTRSGYQATKSLKAIVDLEKLEAVIEDGMYDCDAAIDISDFKIAETKKNRDDLMVFISKEMFKNFHFSTVNIESLNGKITKIKPVYFYTVSEYRKMLSAIDKAKAKILKDIKGNKYLSAAEKALLIHDRLSLVCEYDHKRKAKNGNNMYGALVDGTAICEGYTQAYGYLLKEAGIESDYCSSQKLNHSWNIVYIDGKAYHVDVTWDDYSWPNGGRGVVGKVRHENFLRSSKGLYNAKPLGHVANDYDTFPTDTKYDRYGWQNSESAFQLVDNKLYYIDHKSGQLKCWDTKKTVCKTEDLWWVSATNRHIENYACLSSGNGELYYSLSKAVYKYDFKTGLSSVVYKPSLTGYKSIYGMEYRDGNFICDVNFSAKSEDSAKAYLVKQAYKPQTPKTVKLSTTSYTYDGKVKHPSVVVKTASGKTLKKDTDYKVTYASGCQNVGTYKVTVKMIGKYTGVKTLTFKINPLKVDKLKLKLAATVYTFNGAAKSPSVSVKTAAGKTLKKGTDYTVTYASGRKNVGAYKVTVKMKGNYSGSKTLTFQINPLKTSVAKLTAGKKSITVSITKKTTQVSGYQVQYSTSKSFAGATAKTLSSNTTTTYTIKNLKAGKTYYVRVRTYKTVNGKKLYSDWSTAKSAKVK